MEIDKLLIGLCMGFCIGLLFGVLWMKWIWGDNIDKWNEVTYKYSYCPYCGEELEIGFDDE